MEDFMNKSTSRRLVKLAAITIGASGILSLPTAAWAQSVVGGGVWFFPGQKLVAPSCFYEAVMQSDGNFVTYGNASTGGNGAVWATGTDGRGGYAAMQTDGNFVIYNWSDQAVWATNTWGEPGNYLYQQDDGNLVVYSSSWQARWASGFVNSEPLGQTPCEATAEWMDIHTDSDMPGDDFENFPLGAAHASWCAYYCSQDSRCGSFTYVPPGVQGPDAMCWLKWHIDAPTDSPGMVSGHKRL
jgi:hypothetical protein